ncbi:MAG: SUMF1/EgtB/PvdO family nonheme iron enzyme [Candidatus Omnitrophota bacterium]
MMRIIWILVIVGVSIYPAFSFANNLSLSNGAVISTNTSADTAVVEFDISWDNSWRDGTNWDAVWLFMKYDTGSGWAHATISSYSSVGTGTALNIVITQDKRGCFIERSGTGSGTCSTSNVRLVWDYGDDGVDDADIENVDLRIFGIEMVYIPAGGFYVGDGSSSASLKQGSTDTDPWYIGSEAAISVEDVNSNAYYYVSGGNAGEDALGADFIIPNSFPKGYGDFYVMKYEITQGQYADFLNTVAEDQAVNRFPDQNGNNRHTITGTYPDYIASRPYRACNFLSWPDVAAYADWAALRPVTELEYEKMARGKDILPVAGELPWGNTSITAATSLSGAENGTETVSNASANGCYNNQTFIDGDGGQGPLRAGIFAIATSTRQQSGSGYYGIMELAGNVWERCVSIGNSTGRSFQGTHGDGVLETASGYEGNATTADWPGYTSGQGVSAGTGAGLKGGSWLETTTGKMAVSDRTEAALGDSERVSDTGGRCGRTND